MLVILYVLSAFSGITPNLPSNRWLKPYQLNACSLVTRADVEEAVGRSVNDGDQETLGRTSTCHYGIKGGLVSITIPEADDQAGSPARVPLPKSLVKR